MPAYNTQHVQLSPALILYTSIKWDSAFTQAGNLSRLPTPKKSQLCQKKFTLDYPEVNIPLTPVKPAYVKNLMGTLW